MNTDGLPQIRSGLIEENEKTMTKSRNQSSSPSRNTHLGFRNQTRSLRVASNNEDVLKTQDEWENLQQQLASLTSFNFDTDLYDASDKDSHNTSISANEDEEILESVGIEAPRSIPLITGHKSHFIDMPSADTDNDGVDGGIGFRKPQMIINREDKYQRRKLNQALSSDRDDAFAAGKKMSDPSARTYVDIMREEALKREQEESNRESKKLIEEISFHEDSVVERVNEVVPEMVLIPLPIQKQQHMLVTSYATCIKSFKDNIGFLDATHLFDQIPLYVSKLPDWQGFVGIVVLLFIHSTVSFIDENNADNAASALMAGLAPNAKVLRDGKWGEQDAAILVPGDIINIKLRDIFSADARLLDGDPLSVDQSVLTGESLPVIELIVTYLVQHRKYRDRIDNLLVLLIGGIPIAMPIVLSVIMSIGSHKLSQQGEITKRVIADDEEDIAEVVHEELPPYKIDGAEENGRLKGLAVNSDEAPEDFTEDGDLGMVMWRHLVLQLHKIEEGLQDYAEFRHLPTKQFTDFSMVRKEIEDETNRMDGKSNQISLVPIHLSIYSTNVVPGLTKVAVEGQPESIVEDIGNLIHSYVDKPNCLILAITPANKDLATSDVVKDLNSNKLTGTLSPYMCSENMLQTLITIGNFLFGSIPESLESWESLNRIQMGDNFMNGLIVLWLTEIIGQARPPRCDEKPCTSATGGQFLFLFSSLALMAVGAGGIRPCSLVVAAIKVLGGGHRFVSIGLGNLNTTVLSVKFKQWDPGLVLEP